MIHNDPIFTKVAKYVNLIYWWNFCT